MTADPERVEKMMGLVNGAALVVLGMPRDKRDAVYEDLRRDYEAAAAEAGLPPAETAEKVIGFVRDMVALVESSGGGTSGTA